MFVLYNMDDAYILYIFKLLRSDLKKKNYRKNVATVRIKKMH